MHKATICKDAVTPYTTQHFFIKIGQPRLGQPAATNANPANPAANPPANPANPPATKANPANPRATRGQPAATKSPKSHENSSRYTRSKP